MKQEIEKISDELEGASKKHKKQSDQLQKASRLHKRQSNDLQALIKKATKKAMGA